jgi:cell division protein FtsN
MLGIALLEGMSMSFTPDIEVQSIAGRGTVSASAKKRARLVFRLGVLAFPILAVGHAAQTSPSGKPTQTPQKNPVIKNDKNNVGRGSVQKECYAIQVGAYKDREEAVATQNELSRQFPNATQVSQLPSRNEIYWRVRMLAASKDEAEALVRRLQQTRWNKSWVVPVPCS